MKWDVGEAVSWLEMKQRGLTLTLTDGVVSYYKRYSSKKLVLGT